MYILQYKYIIVWSPPVNGRFSYALGFQAPPRMLARHHQDDTTLGDAELTSTVILGRHYDKQAKGLHICYCISNPNCSIIAWGVPSFFLSSDHQSAGWLFAVFMGSNTTHSYIPAYKKDLGTWTQWVFPWFMSCHRVFWPHVGSATWVPRHGPSSQELRVEWTIDWANDLRKKISGNRLGSYSILTSQGIRPPGLN